VKCLLKVVIAEPEETAVAKKWLCKHVSTATNSRDRGHDYARKIEELLEAMFSVG
jgi:hypothetical protein